MPNGKISKQELDEHKREASRLRRDRADLAQEVQDLRARLLVQEGQDAAGRARVNEMARRALDCARSVQGEALALSSAVALVIDERRRGLDDSTTALHDAIGAIGTIPTDVESRLADELNRALEDLTDARRQIANLEGSVDRVREDGAARETLLVAERDAAVELLRADRQHLRKLREIIGRVRQRIPAELLATLTPSALASQLLRQAPQTFTVVMIDLLDLAGQEWRRWQQEVEKLKRSREHQEAADAAGTGTEQPPPVVPEPAPVQVIDDRILGCLQNGPGSLEAIRAYLLATGLDREGSAEMTLQAVDRLLAAGKLVQVLPDPAGTQRVVTYRIPGALRSHRPAAPICFDSPDHQPRQNCRLCGEHPDCRNPRADVAPGVATREAAIETAYLDRPDAPPEEPGRCTVTRLDGKPIERDQDGMVRGEPLDLTDAERAALPKLDPDADNDPARYVVGYGPAPAPVPGCESCGDAPPCEQSASELPSCPQEP